MTDTQKTHVSPTNRRRHMAELVQELPNDLWLQFQTAASEVPEVQAGVEANQSFRTIRALIDNGYGELGGRLAGVVQSNLRSNLATA
ncbi:MAG TPA: hypothetical protein VFH06_03735 [Candidatus Saccharimonadales bacterium]|nr:hypothetical protein [Candidatus Saccharimonadales bacterium]